VGPEHARALIFRKQATIETMVLEKGCVEARSELRGEKWVSSNHLWTRPQSRGHMKFITQGHIVKRSHKLTRQKLGSWPFE
jgi:hypothetical protein